MADRHPRRKVVSIRKSAPNNVHSIYYRAKLTCGHEVATTLRNDEAPKTCGCYVCTMEARDASFDKWMDDKYPLWRNDPSKPLHQAMREAFNAGMRIAREKRNG